MMGMPAFLVSLLGAVIFLHAQYGNKESVEDHYKFLLEKSKSDLILLHVDVQRENAVLTRNSKKFQLSEEQLEKIKLLRSSQKIYVDKLISLSPNNNDYRYELAQFAKREGREEQRWSILEDLAPEDKAGYAQAHLEIAGRDLLVKPIRQYQVIRAQAHLENALLSDSENETAKLMLAALLSRKKDYARSARLFRELLDDNPNVFRRLVELNNLQGKSEDNPLVIKTALQQFEDLAKKREVFENNQRWLSVQRGIADSLMQLGRYEEAANRIGQLEKGTGQSEQGTDNSSQTVFLRKLMAGIYHAWARDIGGLSPGFNQPLNIQRQTLEKFRLAYSYDKRNDRVLQGLAELSISRNPEIAQQAKEIYNPFEDSGAPALVLNQLGTGAMISKDYDAAILHYEKAKDKFGASPVILNNLAFSYLVAEETNPVRALELIRAAISKVDRRQIGNISNYLHTQGTALKQLNRLSEAILSFESSIKYRPDHPDTLQSVIECYRGLGLDPPEIYFDRLNEISNRKQNPQTP